MYIHAILGDYAQWNELVALCDLSQTRMDFYNQQIQARAGSDPLPTYHADDFDRMIAETKPDVVIVTTMDATHHQYICRAMELGCDAITEKPMTTDDAKARQIFDTIEKTGRSLRVTFNYRYAPLATTVRELIMQGAIGRPRHVDFSWVLDTRHGADYFRRWHREKDKSGGLLVHKSTHHFDLINWWIDSIPHTVYAQGDLHFYGRENAAARGETYTYDRYTGEEAAANDPFAISLESDDTLKSLYLNAEADSGYLRDRNVFGDNITAEDTMSVTARYRNGIILSPTPCSPTAPGKATAPPSPATAAASKSRPSRPSDAPSSPARRRPFPEPQTSFMTLAASTSGSSPCTAHPTKSKSPKASAATAAATASCWSRSSTPTRPKIPSPAPPPTSTAPPPSCWASPPTTPSPPASPSPSMTS